MPQVRPSKRKRVTPSYSNDASGSENPFQSPRERSIFSLIDEYEADVEEGPNPPLQNVQPQRSSPANPVTVFNVGDSSDDEEANDTADRVLPTPNSNGKLEERKVGKEEGEVTTEDVDAALLRCGVCFSPTSDGGEHDPYALPCGHVFGERCINKWHRTKMPTTCPNCSTFTPGVQKIRLFGASSRDDIREEAKALADEVDDLKEKHRAEIAALEEKHRTEQETMIQLNQLMFKSLQGYAEALGQGVPVRGKIK